MRIDRQSYKFDNCSKTINLSKGKREIKGTKNIKNKKCNVTAETGKIHPFKYDTTL